MGLVARELESRGIATVCLMLLREVAEKVRPPRSLVVPDFGWGQPLGPPGDAATHRRVALQALEMTWERREPAALRDFRAGFDGRGVEDD